MLKSKIAVKLWLSVVFMTTSTLSGFGMDGGDIANGEQVFKRCMNCHMIGQGAKNKVGPVLNEIFGRGLGTFPDYKYSPSMVKAGEQGLAWTPSEVFIYLADPKKYLRTKLNDNKAKTKMTFKLKNEEDRKDIIAYLKSFSPDFDAGDSSSESEKASD